MSSFSLENQGGISFEQEEGLRKYSAVDSSNKLKHRLPAISLNSASSTRTVYQELLLLRPTITQNIPDEVLLAF